MAGQFRDLIRKRIAPLAFVGALALLAVETCEVEAASVTVRYELGESAARVEHLRVDYFRDGEPIDAYYERDFEQFGGPIEHRMDIPGGLYEARIRLRSSRDTRVFSRRFEAAQGNVAVLDLSAEVP